MCSGVSGYRVMGHVFKSGEHTNEIQLLLPPTHELCVCDAGTNPVSRKVGTFLKMQ